ncbi:hypothetical protein HI914_02231 [Erysiphe necator]|nr:hypothetical protein HI914_02231 [Erysiphe necator]
MIAVIYFIHSSGILSVKSTSGILVYKIEDNLKPDDDRYQVCLRYQRYSIAGAAFLRPGYYSQVQRSLASDRLYFEYLRCLLFEDH